MKEVFAHTIELSDDWELDVEYRFTDGEKETRDYPAEPALFEIESVWLIDRITDKTTDITTLDCPLVRIDFSELETIIRENHHR